MKWSGTSVQLIGQIWRPRCHSRTVQCTRHGIAIYVNQSCYDRRKTLCVRSYSGKVGHENASKVAEESSGANFEPFDPQSRAAPRKPPGGSGDSNPFQPRPERVRCWDLHFSPRFQIEKREDGSSPEILVTVQGHIRMLRKQKERTFAAISDGSSSLGIQLVFESDDMLRVAIGSSVQATGLWKVSKGNEQPCELLVTDFFVLGDSDSRTYPIQPKNTTLEQMRNFPHLRIRDPVNSALNRLRSALLFSVNNYFHGSRTFKGTRFVQVHPPLITSSDCEGSGQVFSVSSTPTHRSAPGGGDKPESHKQPSFFKTPQYMTVSSQLHLEAYAAELVDVWALSPTFRAEPSDTPRHLAEFYMLEVESGNMTRLDHLISLTAHLIRSLLRGPIINDAIQDFHLALNLSSRDKRLQTGVQLDQSIRNITSLLDPEPWPIYTYTACMTELLHAADQNPTLFDHPPSPTQGLKLEHERWIVEVMGNNRPVFVTMFPKSAKPFYMYTSNRSDPQAAGNTVECFDLLFPFGAGEVAGGSRREHRLEVLIENMRRAGMLRSRSTSASEKSVRAAESKKDTPPSSSSSAELYPDLQPGESLGALEWYADLRRYGTTRHGGFGIGFDRLLAFITATQNLRDVVAFPRSHRRAKC